MSTIKDDRQMRIGRPSLELETREHPVKQLDYKTADLHLRELSRMLRLMSRLAYEKMPDAKDNHDFHSYLLRLGEAVELMAARNHIELKKPTSDVTIESAILPTDSGFPLFIRDFYILERDKAKAQEALKQLPSNAKLVQDALYSLFRDFFPHDIILEKLMRDYFERLAALELSSALRPHPEILVKNHSGKLWYKKSFERFDDHYNVPRFYTSYFTTPSSRFLQTEWKEELEAVVKHAFTTSILASELSNLARTIEAIDGINLQGIERFDVGPFYNRNTVNSPAIQILLEQGTENDAILMMKKSQVVRAGENQRRGLPYLLGLLSGDTSTGIFSPILESPQYALMAHRLIQKIHHLDLQFGKGMKMYGITTEGGLVD